jgi:hypothetical protein
MYMTKILLGEMGMEGLEGEWSFNLTARKFGMCQGPSACHLSS